MLSLSFTQKDLQMIHLKDMQLLHQIHFATVTHDYQIKPVHSLVKHEIVLPSQKDDCHLILAEFGNNQFSIRNNDPGANIIVKPVDSFSLEAVKPIQSQYKKPIKKNTKTLIQQYAILNDTDTTDNDDPIGKRIPQDDDPFNPDLSLFN